MKRILVLGGYGGFGARLSRRLLENRFRVIVAGRNLSAAEAFCSAHEFAEPLQADRNGDIATIIKSVNPDLVIDAAGPFQNSGYNVPLACIDAQIPYIDLADASDFVVGISALDMAAKQAGVAIISGASSVPALSGAVIKHIVSDLDDVRTIDIMISASNRATAGASVSSAILSYVGKPITMWRSGRWTKSWGWQSLRRQYFDLGRNVKLSRLVALADVPDHAIFPRLIKGAPAVTFRAGPEFSFQTLALWLLSWLVRWGLIRSIAPLANWLRHLQGLTSRLGSDRSFMMIDVKGFRHEEAINRIWTLIAENGDGPEIPTLAAALLSEVVLKNRMMPGARHAADLLTLEQFETAFAKLAIHHNQSEKHYIPVYKRVMGIRFQKLPKAVRNMHLLFGDGSANGHAHVVRGTNKIARLICDFMRFPKAGQHELYVGFTEQNGVESWTRDFGGLSFTSHLSEKNGQLIKRFGPLRFVFDLSSSAQGLTMTIRRWTFLYLPLPLFLGPESNAREWEDGDDFCFDVPITLPLIGLIVHYSGRLCQSQAIP